MKLVVDKITKEGGLATKNELAAVEKKYLLLIIQSRNQI